MSAATRSIKVGDAIQYRPGWGKDAPIRVIVTGLEITQYPREKYGEEVTEVSYGMVDQNRVILSLDNSRWCYGNQVDIDTQVIEHTTPTGAAMLGSNFVKVKS